MITPKLPTGTSLNSAATAASKRDPQTYGIIGAALEVHKELGHGFLEAVFQEALEVELGLKGIPFQREHAIKIFYRGKPLRTEYRCDFLCFGDLIVELKAIKTLTEIEEAQVINYLKATGFRKALLINFGAPSLQHKRLVYGPAEFFEKR